jgi:hypothetical protein
LLQQISLAPFQLPELSLKGLLHLLFSSSPYINFIFLYIILYSYCCQYTLVYDWNKSDGRKKN